MSTDCSYATHDLLPRCERCRRVIPARGELVGRLTRGRDVALVALAPRRVHPDRPGIGEERDAALGVRYRRGL